jgi:multicomponent Na+:H+ antiporter subunit B
VSARARRIVFLTGAAGFGVLLLWALAGLPGFGRYRGPYGLVANRVGGAETNATNVVAAITFDYRGFDTLGEEFILLTAVTSVALLLRAQREEEERPATDESLDRRAPQDSDAVRELSLGLVAPAVLFGLYMALHGHLTPGGGFQGGVILATAPLLMYLGGEYRGLRTLSPETLVELGEGAGAGAYVGVGAAGLWLAGAFLANFLPPGTTGDLWSSGIILILNLAVALAVASGVVLLLTEFLEQTLEVRRRKKSA